MDLLYDSELFSEETNLEQKLSLFSFVSIINYYDQLIKTWIHDLVNAKQLNVPKTSMHKLY